MTRNLTPGPIPNSPEEGKTVAYPPPPPDFGDRFLRIMVYPVDGECGSFPLGYGEYPRIVRPRGVEIIIPEHYKVCLDDSKVSTFRHVNLSYPDPSTGNVYRKVPHTIVRFPYQIIGPATKEEFLADQDKYKPVEV